MTKTIFAPAATLFNRARALFAANPFTDRDFILHDGRTLRRFKVPARAQATIAGVAAVMMGFSGYGVASAAQASGLTAPAVSQDRLAQMETKLGQMRAKVATIRHTAELHATRIEHRQALIAAALTGKGDARKLALATLAIDPAADRVAAPAIDPAADRVAAPAIAPFMQVEQRQLAQAGQARAQLDARLATASTEIRRLGLKPERVIARSKSTAMGGPLIEASSAEASADIAADAQFRSLFQSWKKLDRLEQGVIAIPSVQPVQHLSFTSNFGIRSDPFRGSAAMHAGVDIPGPIGTPIYATADGVISHAGRQGGYGNLVEINHGKGIATRYGHLSKILVADNVRVTRGQLIGMMGSTGRSTGSHLHYEVRIDGHAVNPVPFLTTADYLLAAQDRSVAAIPVSTGPAPLD